MAKAAFSKKKAFTRKVDLNLRKIIVKCYIWRWNLGTSENKSQFPGMS